MAPRQRNVSTPTASEDESCSDDAAATTASSQELRSRSNRKSLETKTASPKKSEITDADIARDNHDYFNVVALAMVVNTIGLNYEFPSLSYTGDHFWTMWAATTIYFLMDLTWVKVVPTCVKSPGVIVKHHIVAMTYLLGPICYPQYRWLMGAILSVELNTWFLICRRLVYRSYYCPSGYAKVSPIITSTVSTFFYITWVAIRCYLYPNILILFFRMWQEEIELRGQVFFWELLFIPVHLVLCVLNLKWTYDLFKPIVKRWMGIGPKSAAVQNGL